MIYGFLQIGDFLFKMLIVLICTESVLFFLGLQFITFDFLLHLIDDSFDSFIGDRIKFLTDVLNTNFVKHFCNKEFRFFIFLLLFFLGFFVSWFLLGCGLLLIIFELLRKSLCFFVILLIFRSLWILFFLVKRRTISLEGLGCFGLLNIRALLSLGLGWEEMFGFLLRLRSEVRLVLSLLLDGYKRRKLLFLFVLHWSKSLSEGDGFMLLS